MTIERMIELLDIEHACVRRNTLGICNRKCENCELVQDDGELHEMYTEVIGLLKDQERKKGKWTTKKYSLIINCSACNADIWYSGRNTYNYCPNCGADMRGEQDG